MSIPPKDESSSHDLICFSHLRWSFVFQRPQHLLGRCARTRRVFYVEEPITSAGPPRLEVTQDVSTLVNVVVPHLPPDLDDEQRETEQARLISELCRAHAVKCPIVWFYTPMALPL